MLLFFCKILKSPNNKQEGFVSFEHIELESMESVDIDLKILDRAKDLTKAMRENAGVVMLYGDLVAKYYENNPKNESCDCQNHLRKAKDLLANPRHTYETKEKLLTKYPKTYIILARLYAVDHDYENAIKCTEKGIRLQKQRRFDNDYIERFADFYDYLTRFKVEKNIEKVNEGLKQIEKQERKNLETVALFTTFISLVIGTFSVIVGGKSGEEISGKGNLPFASWEIISVIFVLFGVVIVSYTLFYFLSRTKELTLLKNSNERERMSFIPMLVVIILGVVLIMFGLYFSAGSSSSRYAVLVCLSSLLPFFKYVVLVAVFGLGVGLSKVSSYFKYIAFFVLSLIILFIYIMGII